MKLNLQSDGDRQIESQNLKSFFMITLAWYLLKVLICSGILCGYYFLALRNKAFHCWNRFYLLASVVISLIVPVIKFDIFQNEDSKGTVVQVLQTISYGDEAVIEYSRNNSFQLSSQNLAEGAYLLISMTLLSIFLISLYKIIKLRRKYPETIIEDISFINTEARGTPFSFFKSIFWNKAIDLHTRTGQQIFNHELAHIQEKHSYDKIFMNLIMILFWINPFFWLMRKELYMIHEFIADKEALEDNDLNAFAEMVLQTVYPGQDFSFTNNFFYSPIKRRILMLTKNRNPKVSYLSRLLVLPLAAIIFFAFTLKVKTPRDKTIVHPETTNTISVNDPSDIQLKSDTIPPMYYQNKKVTGLQVQSKSDKIKVTAPVIKVTYDNGTTEMISKEESDKRGFVLPPPPPSGLPPHYFKTNMLFVVDGKITPKEKVKSMDPKSMGPIYILKKDEAIKKYGDKGKYGAIEIHLKKDKGETTTIKADSIYFNSNLVSNQLIFINGKEATEEDLQSTPPGDIESITILKSTSGELLYGDKGKNGVVKIITKEGRGKVTLVSTDAKYIYGAALTNKSDTLPGKVYTKVEVEAQFPGGPGAWQKYITSAIQASLDSFTNADFGTCVLRFIVNVDGTVSDVQATTMKGTLLAKISVNAIRKGPKWTPASQNGITVAAYRLQPVTLSNPSETSTKTDTHKNSTTFNKPNDDKMIFVKLEKSASFPGGQASWLKYISRVFEKNGNKLMADKNNLGTCKVKFIVNQDGTVSDMQAMNKQGTQLAELAMNTIKEGPRWNPGMQNGRIVNSYVIQSVSFVLNDRIMGNEPE